MVCGRIGVDGRHTMSDLATYTGCGSGVEWRGSEGWSIRRGARKRERVGPSSKASREAAAPRFSSDVSKPPFGTRGGRKSAPHVSEGSEAFQKRNDDFTTLTDPKILPLSTCDYHDFNFTGRSPDRYSAAHDPWFSAAFRRHEERLSVELDQEDCLKISRG
jgi:hypothetical protein